MDCLLKLCGLLDWIHPSVGASSRPNPDTGHHDPLDIEVELNTILNILFGLQDWVRSSSRWHTPQRAPLHIPERLTDEVYEVFKPTGTPSVEIVFFHGLQLQDSQTPYITTWVSRDESEVWLLWLRDEFPQARILTISYDAFAKRTAEKGITSMYVTRENLLYSLTMSSARIGQDGCPVVLVWHCLGGLVMKEVCVQANSILGWNRPDEADELVENLLVNVKGLFFYATPHHGSRLADTNTTFRKGKLLEDLTTLNTDSGRRNYEFVKVRNKYGWKASGVGETLPVTLGNFTGVVVPEASSRHEMERYYTITDADHFNVCRPESRKANNFSLLSDFIAGLLREDEALFSTKTSLLEGVIGFEAGVKQVVKKLQKSQRLAIIGMGGIGKTTLAQVVFESISGNFDYTCFFNNVEKWIDVKVVDPMDLQCKIMSRMMYRGRKVKLELFRWSKLKGKKVLLVLDDVESESQVMVMTELDGFSSESRLIVTCRNSQFLDREVFDLHSVAKLNMDDSKRLFCLHAFKRPVAHRAYEERVTRFAEKCRGFPLALKIAGRYLGNKQNEGTWDDAFDNLSRAVSITGSETAADEMLSILTVTYYGLAPKEQEMFLDVAACFNGDNLKQVKILWRGCGWGPDSMWQNLMDRGMVSKDYECIHMHEVLCDLGRSIAMHTRVIGLDVARLLNYEAKESVKVLKSNREYFGGENVDFGVIAGLKELRILSLNKCWEFNSTVLDSVGDLFPRQLSSLKIDGDCAALLPQICGTICSLRSFIFMDQYAPRFPSSLCLGQLSRLQHLELRHCTELQELPDEFGDLRDLRRLSLRDCSSLQYLPDSFVHLKALERLDIFDCQELRALPDKFGELQNLRRLSVKDCMALEELPNSFVHLKALERLDIFDCLKFRALPDKFGELQKLRHLSIKECFLLEELPNSFVKLQELEVLEFYSCENLVIALSCLWELGGVEELRIWYCKSISGCRWYELTIINEKSWTLEVLRDLAMEELKVMRAVENDVGVIIRVDKDGGDPDWQDEHKIINFYCGSIARLPDHFGQSHELLELYVMECGRELPNSLFQNRNIDSSERRFQLMKTNGFYNCPNMSSVRESLGQLQGLETLIVYHSLCLVQLPESLGQLKKLKELSISSCPSLTKLPESLGQLTKLKKLSIFDCSCLTKLPESIGQLSGTLETLEIWLCLGLEATPETLGQLRALKHLRIRDCPLLTELPKSTWRLGALEELAIRDCLGLKEIPESLGQLGGTLKTLEIWFCPGLEAIPETLGQLQALTHLRLRGCPLLTELPKSTWRLGALEELAIRDCPGLKEIPESLGRLGGTLETLEICQCPALEVTPETLGQLQALKHLKITGFPLLTELLESACRLGTLEKLGIRDCPCLTKLPESLGQLGGTLETLEIRFCPGLEALPETLGQLQALKHLRIRECPLLTELPKSAWQLGALEELSIKVCPGLKEIPESRGQLGGTLKTLEISECPALKVTPETLGQFQVLKHLKITGFHLLTTGLTELLESACRLGALENLCISDCPSLTELPESLGQLGGTLESLDIWFCPSLEAIPETLGQLQALKHLRIRYCPLLTELPESAWRLGALEELSIRDCPDLKEIRDLKRMKTLRRKFRPEL